MTDLTYSALLNGYSYNYVLRNASPTFLFNSLQTTMSTYFRLLGFSRLSYGSSVFNILFSQHTYLVTLQDFLSSRREAVTYENRITRMRYDFLDFVVFDRFYILGSANKSFHSYGEFDYVEGRFIELSFSSFSEFTKKRFMSKGRALSQNASFYTVLFKFFLMLVIFFNFRHLETLEFAIEKISDLLSAELAFIVSRKVTLLGLNATSFDF